MPMKERIRRKPRGANTLPAEPRTYGQKIRQARLEHGWTQQDLAERIGITKSAVSEWERDKIVELTLTNAQAVYDVLGVEPSPTVRNERRLVMPRVVDHSPRASQASERRVTFHGRSMTEEAADVGVEWDKLDQPAREAFRTVLLLMVAAQRRGPSGKRPSADGPHGMTPGPRPRV